MSLQSISRQYFKSKYFSIFFLLLQISMDFIQIFGTKMVTNLLYLSIKYIEMLGDVKCCSNVMCCLKDQGEVYMLH